MAAKDEEKNKDIAKRGGPSAVSKLAENIRKTPKIDTSSKSQASKPETDEGLSPVTQQALIGAGSTLLGALFGGTQGAAIGAQAGKEGIQTFQRIEGEQKKLKEQKEAREAALKAQEAKEDRAFARKKELEGFKQSFQRLARSDKQVTDLRKERSNNQVTKDTAQVVTSFEKIQRAAQEPTAANDISLIFNFMKMNDPGSVVREGEFATAQNAAGVPDRIRNVYNRLVSGERLGETQRAEFVSSAGGLLRSQLAVQDRVDIPFRKEAERLGIPQDRVIFDIRPPVIPDPPQIPANDQQRGTQETGPGILSRAANILKPEANASESPVGLNEQKMRRLEELRAKAGRR